MASPPGDFIPNRACSVRGATSVPSARPGRRPLIHAAHDPRGHTPGSAAARTVAPPPKEEKPKEEPIDFEKEKEKREREATENFEAGIQHYEAGRFTEAIDSFVKATNLKPDHAAAIAYLGASHFADNPGEQIMGKRPAWLHFL